MDLNIQTLIGSGSTIIISILVAYITSKISIAHSKKQFLKQNKRQSIERGIELAKFYAEEIIPLTSYVHIVYGRNEALKPYYTLLKQRNEHSSLYFNLKESEELFKDDIAKIRRILKNHESNLENIIDAHIKYTKEFKIKDYISVLEDNGNITINNNSFKLKLFLELDSITTRLLNNLEYFSMLIVKEIADGDVVYQSLHQTFRATALFLYFDIALANKDNKDKYFTNFIDLYNDWSNIYFKTKSKENNFDESLLHKGDTFDPKL